jgi:protoporphyrinogen oxidase
MISSVSDSAILTLNLGPAGRPNVSLPQTPDFDVAVVGAGISGLCFAHYAARAGLRCALIERDTEPGGCIRTVRTSEGFWFELGAHTLYNSYGSLLQIIETTGIRHLVQRRSKAPYRLWVDGKIRSIPSELAMGELVTSIWRAFTERKAGRTVGEYYGRLVGKRNWTRVLSAVVSGVPSQRADGFPADMLFKRRPRRKDYPRTFTLSGGLGSLVERVAHDENITLVAGAQADRLGREGSRFAVETAAGDRIVARRLALAVPAPVAARLLAEIAPDTARALAQVGSAAVVSTGVVVAKGELAFPRLAGLFPLQDAFFSVVTRDVVEDERFRAFAFHFRSGLSLDERLDRIARVVGVSHERFLHVAEHAASLPSPGREHASIVRAVDAGLAGLGVYLTGNYFGGLALEDCALRSRSETERLLAERHIE